MTDEPFQSLLPLPSDHRGARLAPSSLKTINFVSSSWLKTISRVCGQLNSAASRGHAQWVTQINVTLNLPSREVPSIPYKYREGLCSRKVGIL